MRICVDATPLLLRSAGVKNYLYHWLVALRKAAGTPDSVQAFPLFHGLGALNHERSAAGLGRTITGLGLLHAANRSGLPLLDFLARRCDVFHASHQLYNPPRNVKLTSTLYDMTCWLMPQLHSKANVRGLKEFAKKVAGRADGLIAISESTRDDSVRILGLDPDRIEVIYPGIAEAFFDVPAERVWHLRQKYGLAKPYVLFIGTIEPRKNTGALLDAWTGLPADLREAHELVLAGPVGWSDPATVTRLRSPAPGVRYLGYVPESDLPALNAGALLLAYPSLYEGFGFPIAQAMAAGVPVVTSGVSSMPEVAGDGALLVDPHSLEDLRAALQRLLLSPSLREDLGRHGKLLAQRYRWDQCARRTIFFFEKVLGA
jgi:glycosyltransferase involved in cell wall biosynthesis